MDDSSLLHNGDAEPPGDNPAAPPRARSLHSIIQPPSPRTNDNRREGKFGVIVGDTAFPYKQPSNEEFVKDQREEGILCDVKKLYEGPAKCPCCINWVEEYPDDLRESIEENAETKRHALVVRLKKNHGGKVPLVLHSIVVQSPLLKRLLGEVFEGYSGITTTLKYLTFRAPFHAFYYRWTRLTEIVKRQHEGNIAAHAQLLYETLRAELKDALAETRDLLDNGVITFDYLWALFETGIRIISADEGHQRFYVLQRCQYKEACGQPFLVLEARYIDWDGTRFGYRSQMLNLDHFDGTKAVTELTAYPDKYHASIDNLTQTVLQRGQKFRDLCGFHYKSYSGIVEWWRMRGPEKRNVDGRIIIDAQSHARFVPNEKVELLPLDSASLAPRLDVLDHRMHHSDKQAPLLMPLAHISSQPNLHRKHQTTDDLTNDHLLICSPQIRGYCLETKRWAGFYVDNVQDVRWNDVAFPNLMLPGDHKDLILSFVESQVTNKAAYDDIIEGKGQGIIMLLAGSPGVGKTLTAEAVADKLRRPLYIMSAAELGQNARSVEGSLDMILDIAVKWDAVLLIDECDVFLEERSSNGLARNEIVATFLRLLEYYRGILFMTTNRADAIDPAFHSRIHLSIQYPSLDASARRHIWAHMVKMSKNSSALQQRDYVELARMDMNGRQIKNLIKTAQLLACKDNSPLNRNHIRTVLRVTGGIDIHCPREPLMILSSVFGWISQVALQLLLTLASLAGHRVEVVNGGIRKSED